MVDLNYNYNAGTRVSTRLHHQIVNDQPVRNAITEERNDNVMSDINQEPPSGIQNIIHIF